MTEIVLKDAAAEIGVDPSYLRRRILQGRLKADKHGGTGGSGAVTSKLLMRGGAPSDDRRTR